MTTATRNRLGLLAAVLALPVVLACGAGSTDSGTERQQPAGNEPAQVEQQQAPEAPEEPAVELPAPEVEEPNEPAQEDVYYENCTAAKEAGAAPLRDGDPGYRPKLDRDGDGVACEQ